MASSECGDYYTYDQCANIFAQDYENVVQDKLDSTMPWIGMYIAAASAACAIAMAADAFNAFRKKKLWFPSKNFSLNAFTLTVLAVAMKLSVDLTSQMLGVNDRLARVSSLVLMSTAIANFMSSLGSMENNEIMLNLAALCVFAITIAGNVSIRLFQMREYHAAQLIMGEKIGSVVSMLVLLATLCSSAVMVPTARSYIESQYSQMHTRISNDRDFGDFSADELRVAVRRYWVMAESGSPEFVISRSAMCVTSGLMSLLMALTLLEAHIRMPLTYKDAPRISSSYDWSINWILVVQSIGVALGTIAPLLRWFTVARFKSTNISQRSFEDEFSVEAYWTQSLRHWRDSPLRIKTRYLWFRKFVHDAKRLLLNLCIVAQILIVRASKLVLLISAVVVSYCFRHISESRESDDLSNYVVLLEGEAELPKTTLTNMCSEVDDLIRIGTKKQPDNLIELLQKSAKFNGVRDLERPNCWSMPVVTLTSIAISLPNITDGKSKQLLVAVNEGLYFAKHIEKTLDSNGELQSIRNAADAVWVGLELYKKWQANDLGRTRTQKETFRKLFDIAEKTVTNFTTNRNNFLVRDPLNWPVHVIAANSMYRITQMIMLEHDDDNPLSDEDMFERLSVMISDILAACLENLACVVMLKCHSNVIKEREKSIHQAAFLLGKSEKIIQTLRERERAFEEQEDENSVDTVSATFQQTYSGHESIEMER
ncbi:hypothetical protein CASFOL_024457 [Castilleja foliolosa]|uniref:Uncharacterized protein n=1 Tax=Castilleja foliolosa TaxID=1961234 RepID=A0ABD3CP99_9LAMI